jgi:membrane associated rhomboid family serine protease
MIPFRDDIPARRYPVITVLLIIANIGVFLYQLSLPPSAAAAFVERFGMVPGELTGIVTLPSGPALLGVFTSMFLHGGWFHLIGNLWYLWLFGDNVEDRMGHFRFLAFYLVSGVAAAAVHVLSDPGGTVPAIGASGAISGVLGAYLVFYPFARILTLVPLFFVWPVVELPAMLVLGSWFVVQILNGAAAFSISNGTTGGVAWWAHVGGFAAGMILARVVAPARRLRRN